MSNSKTPDLPNNWVEVFPTPGTTNSVSATWNAWIGSEGLGFNTTISSVIDDNSGYPGNYSLDILSESWTINREGNLEIEVNCNGFLLEMDFVNVPLDLGDFARYPDQSLFLETEPPPAS